MSCYIQNYDINIEDNVGDHVTRWVKKICPYNNPQETHNYYSPTFCHLGSNPTHKWGGHG